MPKAKKLPIEVRTAENGSPYYVVKGGNGEILVASETFTTMANVKKGINALIRACAKVTPETLDTLFPKKKK